MLVLTNMITSFHTFFCPQRSLVGVANPMTGTMPSEIGNLEKLRGCGSTGNQFTGQMPSRKWVTWGDMGDLRLHFQSLQWIHPSRRAPRITQLSSLGSLWPGTLNHQYHHWPRWQLADIPHPWEQLWNSPNGNGTPRWFGFTCGCQEHLTGSMPIGLCLTLFASSWNQRPWYWFAVPTNGVGAPRSTASWSAAQRDTVTGYCIRELIPKDWPSS
jgi:hypothetical protein